MGNKMNDYKDYVRVFWKRKWSIFFPTLICVILTGVLSFVLKSKWEVDCVIKPSQLLIQTESGSFQQIQINDPLEIATLINQETYLQPISGRLDLDLEKFPRIAAEQLGKTNLVKISLRTAERELGKAILVELFELLQVELDRRIQLENRKLDSLALDRERELARKELEIEAKNKTIQSRKNEIELVSIDLKTAEIQKKGKRMEIESTQNLLALSMKRAEEVAQEMDEIRSRIRRIESNQEKVLAGGSDPLGLLLYSNEIQENLRFVNTLNQQLNQEMVRQENLKSAVQKVEEELEKIDMLEDKSRTQIKDLNVGIELIQNDIRIIENEKLDVQNSMDFLSERKSRTELSQLVKEPTSSIFPVSPKKRLNVALAAVFGFVLFVLVAFFQEYAADTGTSDKKS